MLKLSSTRIWVLGFQSTRRVGEGVKVTGQSHFGNPWYNQLTQATVSLLCTIVFVGTAMTVSLQLSVTSFARTDKVNGISLHKQVNDCFTGEIETHTFRALFLFATG